MSFWLTRRFELLGWGGRIKCRSPHSLNGF